MFGCSLLLTCTETGESRFLSPLHVNHRKTNPYITDKLLTGSKNSNMYKRAPKFIQQVEFSGRLYMLEFEKLNPFIPNIFFHPYKLGCRVVFFIFIQILKETSVSKKWRT